MSGGSLDYMYSRVFDAAREIHCRLNTIEDVTRRAKYKAFSKHVDAVAKALHDVEWVFSSDYGEDGADKSIDAVIGKTDALKSLIEDAKEIKAAIDKILEGGE